ncbi:MAG: transcription antitermination factor NusB [Pseudomonadota bacterium]
MGETRRGPRHARARTSARRPVDAGGRLSPEEAGVDTARGAAAGLIAGVLDHRRILGEARLGHLSPPERAEAMSLADLTLRRLGEIDAVLARFVDRVPGPPAIHLLRLMAAEILHAGRPAHAAVDGAVKLARSEKATLRMAGLINAVGRKLSGAPEPKRPPAINTPDWLAQALAADWGREEANRIMRAHRAPPPSHDLSLKNPADAGPLAAETGGTLLPSGTLRLDGRPQISALPGFEAGAWWVQDAAAALPALLLEGEPGAIEGKRVLDLCAAPGGKTMQLAAMGAEVTALDVNEARLKTLSHNLERTGLVAEVVAADARDWQPEAPFDAILLDAPCSATGTARRHGDLVWRLAPDDIPPLLELQASLLARAWGWLAPGGRLVYATCSLLRAEGEDQIASFLEAMPGVRLSAMDGEDPRLPPGVVTAEGTLRTLPSMLPEVGALDGFFAACLELTA